MGVGGDVVFGSLTSLAEITLVVFSAVSFEFPLRRPPRSNSCKVRDFCVVIKKTFLST